MKIGDCKACGKSFSRPARGNDSFTYCSRLCGLNGRLELRRTARGIAEGMIGWARNWKSCEQCESLYVSSHQQARTCSKACSVKRTNRVAREQHKKKAGATRPCQSCGIVMDRIGKRRLCAECKLKAMRDIHHGGKARRRTRIKCNGNRDVIRRSVVFNRDGWTCHLCGEECDRNEKVPHPRSATLDHVIPLSKGGTHTIGNVRCAHFECNWMKGDAVDGNVTEKIDAYA